jgi:hypothetical protein
MLTADELNQLRADVMETMPGTAVIKRLPSASATPDTSGFIDTENFVAIGTVVCRLDPADQNDMLRGVINQGSREAMKVFFVLTVPWNTNIDAGDRLVVAGKNYELKSLHEEHSMRAVTRGVVAWIEGG